jgi:hypothetical protein
MNEYPDWLVDAVAETIAFTYVSSLGLEADEQPLWVGMKEMYVKEAIAVLDALNFVPDYKAYRRADRDRMETDTWSGTVVSPAMQKKRREALDEILRFGREQEEQS